MALSAVTSFAEWVDFVVLFTRECKLLVLLYKFITTEELKRVACECLLVILSRKVNEIISNHSNYMVSQELHGD